MKKFFNIFLFIFVFSALFSQVVCSAKTCAELVKRGFELDKKGDLDKAKDVFESLLDREDLDEFMKTTRGYLSVVNVYNFLGRFYFKKSGLDKLFGFPFLREENFEAVDKDLATEVQKYLEKAFELGLESSDSCDHLGDFYVYQELLSGVDFSPFDLDYKEIKNRLLKVCTPNLIDEE